MSRPKPSVHVWALGNSDSPESMPPGLIVLCPSGVIWSNQGGGIACAHPAVEGVYVPLPWKAGQEFPHFCTWGTGEIETGAVQAAIDRERWPLRADHSRWEHGMEAWWPVVVREDAGQDEFDPLFQFRGRLAILVTENCD